MSEKTWTDRNPRMCAMVKTAAAGLGAAVGAWALYAILVYLPFGNVVLACMAAGLLYRFAFPSLDGADPFEGFLKAGYLWFLGAMPVMGVLTHSLLMPPDLAVMSVAGANAITLLMGALTSVGIGLLVVMACMLGDYPVHQYGPLRCAAGLAVIACGLGAAVAILSWVPYAALLASCGIMVAFYLSSMIRATTKNLVAWGEGTVFCVSYSECNIAVLAGVVFAYRITLSEPTGTLLGDNILALLGAIAFPILAIYACHALAWAARRTYGSFYVQCVQENSKTTFEVDGKDREAEV
jgi:hypothetical protein